LDKYDFYRDCVQGVRKTKEYFIAGVQELRSPIALAIVFKKLGRKVSETPYHYFLSPMGEG